MAKTNYSLALFGSGGFGRDVASQYKKDTGDDILFIVDDLYYSNQKNTIPFSQFVPEETKVIVAVADPIARKGIVQKFPKNTVWGSYISKDALIYSNCVSVGEGSIICPGAILTQNIELGKHTHLNIHTSVGHDSIVGDYFTCSPGAKVSGNCRIGDNVFIGTNAVIREKLQVVSNTSIGLLAGVVSDITTSGTYVGTPAKKIQ
tara:strand:- start:5457 stop:6068 length:612 start_codon:yes stop_codon:yes gene_type:complete